MSLESMPDLSDDTIQNLFALHLALNDAHRRAFDGALGEVNIGGSAADLSDENVSKVRQAIRDTENFDDDIHGRGHVFVDDRQYRWVITRYTSKAKVKRCDGRLLGYRELMIAYPEDFILPMD
ncbi:hypothetical protein [Pararhizobium qamdonense]|uniref:hypothetical protein n=1 Tax=Pararhizobium qamdonense TaxID=3031126 RepID=UPI0023E16348|nr:hypothetical protein [Pararhizobium qamdonense]